MELSELKERQGWSLQQKIDHSLEVIETFYARLDGKVYVSFSGGKDSTIVLWLARKLFPDIKAVFCNTGNEYPDIVKFVRQRKNSGENIEIIYPELRPKEVLATYGFPLVSKEVSDEIYYAKYRPETLRGKRALGLLDENRKFKALIPKKWTFLVHEDYMVSNKCCLYLKKKPMQVFEKRTGLHPILGTMASESDLRTASYLHRGGV